MGEVKLYRKVIQVASKGIKRSLKRGPSRVGPACNQSIIYFEKLLARNLILLEVAGRLLRNGYTETATLKRLL